jgi:predicted dehydrogenase
VTKIGIIGCGWIAEKAYLPILTKMNDIEICAIFDIESKKTIEIQEKYHVPNVFDNINHFLLSPLDAVIIATPNSTHTYYTDMALNAGKHVLCEKPVALSKRELESTLAIAQNHKKFFFPAYVNRFRKDIMKLNEIVSLIGEIKEVDVSWIRKSGIPRPGTWITNKAEAGGGVLIDIGTHVIDIGLSFLSDKRIQLVNLDQGTVDQSEQRGAKWSTTDDTRHFKLDVETWAKGVVSFADHSILSFNVSWSSDVSEDNTNFKVMGVNGIVSLNTLFGFSKNFIRGNIEIIYAGKEGKSDRILYPMRNTFALDAFCDMIKHFVETINGQASKILQSSDGICVVDVIEQLYKTV